MERRMIWPAIYNVQHFKNQKSENTIRVLINCDFENADKKVY
jgi:hypothetical protein